jgi:hypothetical protein
MDASDRTVREMMDAAGQGPAEQADPTPAGLPEVIAPDPYEAEVAAGMAGYQKVRRERDAALQRADELTLENERLKIEAAGAREEALASAKHLVDEAVLAGKRFEVECSVLRGQLESMERQLQLATKEKDRALARAERVIGMALLCRDGLEALAEEAPTTAPLRNGGQAAGQGARA